MGEKEEKAWLMALVSWVAASGMLIGLICIASYFRRQYLWTPHNPSQDHCSILVYVSIFVVLGMVMYLANTKFLQSTHVTYTQALAISWLQSSYTTIMTMTMIMTDITTPVMAPAFRPLFDEERSIYNTVCFSSRLLPPVFGATHAYVPEC